VYFTHVLHLNERITEAMLYGRESHDESIITPIIAKIKASKVLRNVELISNKLKLKGKIDYLIITKFNELIPIEIKWSELEHGTVKRDHKLQLAAYSLMIEENFNKIVKRAIVYYTRIKKLITIPIDENIKNEVKHIMNEISKIVSNEEIPKVIKPKHCINCGFRVYCRQESF